jgi:hypothetical protein
MAKKRRRASLMGLAAPVGLPFAPPMGTFGFGFGQPAVSLEQRRIVGRKEGRSEFTLDDGTILRIKPVLVDAKRVHGQYGVDGKPTYVLTVANITETDAPAKLMRHVPGSAPKRRKKK